MTDAGAAPGLTDLAAAALRVLARDGAPAAAASKSGEPGWRAMAAAGGAAIEIGLAGPDIPAAVPEETAPPALVAEQPQWAPTYRLSVIARLLVLDLAWRPGEPLRVMSFSRGDWERDLLAAG